MAALFERLAYNMFTNFPAHQLGSTAVKLQQTGRLNRLSIP